MLENDPHILEVDDGMHLQPKRFFPGFGPVTIGRDGVVKIAEDNPLMHRVLLLIDFKEGNWYLTNVGTRLVVNVGPAGNTNTPWLKLGPQGSYPLPVGTTSVSFDLSGARYGVDVRVTGRSFPTPRTTQIASDAPATAGHVEFTADQRELLTHLTKRLRQDPNVTSDRIPSVKQLSEQLHCSEKAVNNRIERICQKLEEVGIPMPKPQKESLARYVVLAGLIS